MMDLNYSKDDIEKIRADIHQRIDRYMNAELSDKEVCLLQSLGNDIKF